MMTNPYVRGRLCPIREGSPSPQAVVDGWLGELDICVASIKAGSAIEARTAYNLLASWGRLLRVRSELKESAQVLAAANKILDQRGAEWARIAATAFTPGAWQDRAAQFETGHMEWEESRRFIQELIVDLDEAELVCLMAARMGQRTRDLEVQLEPCRDWCLQNADLLLPASAFVQAVGATLMPNLLERDPDLALTALKFEAVLDAAERAASDLEMPGVEVLDVAVVKPLWESFQASRISLKEEWQRWIVAVNLIRQHLRRRAMARAREATEPRYDSWQWIGPEGQAARLTIPLEPEQAENECVALEIVGSDRQRALYLSGQRVIVNGIEGIVDKTGKAVFSLLRLLDTDRPLSLLVGEPPLEWKLVSTSGPKNATNPGLG